MNVVPIMHMHVNKFKKGIDKEKRTQGNSGHVDETSSGNSNSMKTFSLVKSI